MKKFSPRFSRRPLGKLLKPTVLQLSRLETRCNPSVTAVLAAGNLTITGDGGSDIVHVTSEADGDIRVQANNGQVNKIFNGNLVTKITANLGDGFNGFDLDLTNSNGFDGDHAGFDQNPNIAVTSGADSDTISINLGAPAGGGGGGFGDPDGRGNASLTFNLGGANDRLTVTAGGDFGGTFNMSVDMGAGNDSVSTHLQGDLDGNAKITANLGTGNDTFIFTNDGDVKSDFEFHVTGDSGNDYVTVTIGGVISGDSVVTADLGAGNDNFSMSVDGDVSGLFDYTVAAGTGNDSASLHIGGNLDGDFTGNVDMGDSNDYFSFSVDGDVNGGFDLEVVTGSGDDNVSLTFGGDINGVTNIAGDLGSGNDSLGVTVEGNIVSDTDVTMEFDGGIGLDTVVYTFKSGELDDINFSSINFENETYEDAGAKIGGSGTNAPTITSVVFGDGTNQRSQIKQIVVTFSAPVTFMGSVASAFTVHRSATAGTSGNVVLTATPATGTASAVTLTFSGTLTEFGSLVDGYYDIMADAAQITGAGGALDGNNDNVAGGSYTSMGAAANKQFRLFGDVNGDGTSTTSDFVALRNVFGVTSTVFDFDNNGAVDTLDLVQFRDRFGVSV